MRSRDFSPVLTQKRALNVIPAEIVLLQPQLSSIAGQWPQALKNLAVVLEGFADRLLHAQPR